MAAMHWGNCQICGREHKVSGVTIAKHGYTIRSGWQEGACYGSGGQPIQISCDLIEGALRGARAYIERTKAEIAGLLVKPLDDKGRIDVFFNKTTRTGQVTTMERVTVQLNDKNQVVLRDYQDKVLKTYSGYNDPKSIDDAARILADRRIAFLEKTITDSEESIVYLTDRLDNWKPSELRLISAADTAKEAPKVHFEAKRYGYTATICTHSAMAAQKSYGKAKTTDRSKVTCAACMKELIALDELPAKKAAEKEKNRVAEIKSLEKDIKEHQKWLKTDDTDPMRQLRFTETIVILTARLNAIKAQ